MPFRSIPQRVTSEYLAVRNTLAIAQVDYPVAAAEDFAAPGEAPSGAETAMALACNHWTGRLRAVYTKPAFHADTKKLVRQRHYGECRAHNAAAVEGYIDAILSELTPGAPIDFQRDIADPLGCRVILLLLQVDLPDALVALANSAGAQAVRPDTDPRTRLSALAKLKPLIAHIDRIVAEQDYPPDGLLAELVETAHGHDLSLVEAATSFIMMIAGGGTFGTTLKLIVRAMLADKSVLAAVRDDAGRLRAIEELLRLHPIIPNVTRYCPADDTFHVGDVIAANRDPARFAQPECFDAGRRPNPHLTFGAGMHACDAAPISRMVLQFTLAKMLTRLRGLRAVAGGEDGALMVMFDARG